VHDSAKTFLTFKFHYLFISTPPKKLKLGLQIGKRLLILTKPYRGKVGKPPTDTEEKQRNHPSKEQVPSPFRGGRQK
jgi:hypothetical protein